MIDVILGLFVIAALLFAYFIPTMLAYGKRNYGAIFVLNLFLGWTGIGWLGALIWAMVEKNKKR